MPSGRSTSCRALAAEPVRQTQMARRPSMISKQAGKAIVAYVKYKYSRTVGLQYISCYVALILGSLTIAYIIMTVRVFIRNIAGGDSSMYYCNVYYIWHPPPAHSSLWRAATCNERTLLPGPEGVRSWQVLLYTLLSIIVCCRTRINSLNIQNQ